MMNNSVHDELYSLSEKTTGGLHWSNEYSYGKNNENIASCSTCSMFTILWQGLARRIL